MNLVMAIWFLVAWDSTDEIQLLHIAQVSETACMERAQGHVDRMEHSDKMLPLNGWSWRTLNEQTGWWHGFVWSSEDDTKHTLRFIGCVEGVKK